jgi:hypothetical protein
MNFLTVRKYQYIKIIESHLICYGLLQLIYYERIVWNIRRYFYWTLTFFNVRIFFTNWSTVRFWEMTLSVDLGIRIINFLVCTFTQFFSFLWNLLYAFSGVANIINKLNGLPFDENDEQLFEVSFSIRISWVFSHMAERWDAKIVLLIHLLFKTTITTTTTNRLLLQLLLDHYSYYYCTTTRLWLLLLLRLILLIDYYCYY